jgi:hypothetical protein
MRIADTVYTRQVDIDRIQALIIALNNDDHVALTLDDGRVLRGIVAYKPTIQQFFDRSGREGSNATVRLDQPALEAPEQAGWIDVFLDRVVSVRHLDRHELEPWYPQVAEPTDADAARPR